MMLYKYDTLDGEEIRKVMEGLPLEKEAVREFDVKIHDYVIDYQAEET